ncbi:hypothetical protein ACIQZD_23505 [Peribacillus sp. NPDC096447]|uniref:hypothetical protein n=1 Tax=Peribacillus sp. NPDC096447 TaxID=3364394 RepID=UPI00381342C2
MSVLKVTLKKVLLLCAVFLIFSESVQAEEVHNQEGKVVYQVTKLTSGVKCEYKIGNK